MTFKSIGNLNYNGTLYKSGEIVNIDDQQLSDDLLKAGIIGVVEATEKPKSTEVETEKKPARKKSIVADLITPVATEESTQETLGV